MEINYNWIKSLVCILIFITLSFNLGCGGGDGGGETRNKLSGTITLSGGTGSVTDVILTLNGHSSRTTQPDSSGKFGFTNLSSGNYTVTPSLSNYSFTPSSYSYSSLNVAKTNQGFSGSYLQISVGGSRNLPVNYSPGSSLNVTLTVDESNGPNGFIIKDYIPSGWTVTSSTPAFSNFDSNTGEVKWVFFGSDIVDMEITYEVTIPPSASGSKTFSGEVLYNDLQGNHTTKTTSGDTTIAPS